jgi:SAM-dependent methyltransferase
MAQAQTLRLTALAQLWLAPVLRRGGHVVDATAGNGQDTRFLARGVGPRGRVDAFDIQARALTRARRRLDGDDEAAAVVWHRADHARMARHLGTETRIDAAMFNLGWLPGGDRTIVTHPGPTLTALETVRARLVPGGRLCVVAYRGHPGGREEASAVADWIAHLPRCYAGPGRLDGADHSTAPALYCLRLDELARAARAYRYRGAGSGAAVAETLCSSPRCP